MKEIKKNILGDTSLGIVLKEMRAFANDHQQTIVGDLVMRLVEISADYERMCDFVLRGYDDDKRPALYNNLRRRAYRLACDWELRMLASKSAGFYHDAAQLASSFPSTHDDVKRLLESYVQNMAMLSLGQEAGTDEGRMSADDVQFSHVREMNKLFCSLLMALQWTRGDEEFYTSLLLSPTIDLNDARTLVGALLLSCMVEPDYHKLGTLLSVYEQAADEMLRQRALVGLALGMPREPNDLFPEYVELANRLTANEDTCQELLELQMQQFYSMNAERDKDTIERDIMPGLMKNQGFRMTGHGIEMQEDDPLQDILHPDAADKAMEELESTVGKMMDMQKRGADVYFGGFSKMKRYAFFYTLSNWFTPFSMEHPALTQSMKGDETAQRLLKVLMKNVPLCESDKFSFALGFGNVYRSLPSQMRELISQNDALVGSMTIEEQNSATYIRRFYLQDLYRFFMLHPQHEELTSPFDNLGRRGDCFFSNPVFTDTPLAEKAPSLERFLLKHGFLIAMMGVLDNYPRETNDDYYLLEGLLAQKCENYKDAQMHLEQALERRPDDVTILKALAHASFLAGDYEKAEDCYQQLCEQHPDNRTYELHLAIAQMNNGHLRQGMDILYRMHYEDEGNNSVRRALAWGLMLEGNLEQAEKHYDVLLDNAQRADYLNAGYCHWFAGNVSRAAELFKRYVAPDTIDARMILSQDFLNDQELLKLYKKGDVDQTIMIDIVCG